MDGGNSSTIPVFSNEELYGAVMDVCMHKLGQQLYIRLRSECLERAEQLMEQVSQSTEVSW